MMTQMLLTCLAEIEWRGRAKVECLILGGMEQSK